MKFLVDANLSPRVAAMLGEQGHDAVHVADCGLLSAADEAILDAAVTTERTVLTADADFAMLVALGALTRPSVIQLRSSDHLTPEEQADLVLRSLPSLEGRLTAGAVASLSPRQLRVRGLPLRDD